MGPVVAMLQATPIDPTLRIFVSSTPPISLQLLCYQELLYLRVSSLLLTAVRYPLSWGKAKQKILVTLPVLTNFIPAAYIHLGESLVGR